MITFNILPKSAFDRVCLLTDLCFGFSKMWTSFCQSWSFTFSSFFLRCITEAVVLFINEEVSSVGFFFFLRIVEIFSFTCCVSFLASGFFAFRDFFSIVGWVTSCFLDWFEVGKWEEYPTGFFFFIVDFLFSDPLGSLESYLCFLIVGLIK